MAAAGWSISTPAPKPMPASPPAARPAPTLRPTKSRPLDGWVLHELRHSGLTHDAVIVSARTGFCPFLRD